MIKLFKILFLKLYEWFEPDDTSKGMAAIHVISFLSFFYSANVVSIFWIMEYLSGLSPKIFSGDSGEISYVILLSLIILILYIAFVQNKSYLILSKKKYLVNNHILRLSHKAFVLLYLFFTILIFIGALILNFRH